MAVTWDSKRPTWPGDAEDLLDADLLSSAIDAHRVLTFDGSGNWEPWCPCTCASYILQSIDLGDLSVSMGWESDTYTMSATYEMVDALDIIEGTATWPQNHKYTCYRRIETNSAGVTTTTTELIFG